MSGKNRMSANWADIFRKKPTAEPVVNNKQKNLNRAQWTAPAVNKPKPVENFVFNVKTENAIRRKHISKLMSGEKTKYKEPWRTRRNLRLMSPLNPNFKRATVNRKRKASNSNSNNNPDR